jgi:hypothetical protein
MSIPLQLLKIPCDLRSTTFPIESIKPHSRVGASESDVVNLSAQRDDLPVDHTSVDTSLVCGIHDVEVVEDLVDVLFPQSTGFGVSCKITSTGSTNERSTSFLWRERYYSAKASSIRMSVGQTTRRWHKHCCSLPYHDETHGSRQNKGETHAWIEPKLWSDTHESIVSNASFASPRCDSNANAAPWR